MEASTRRSSLRALLVCAIPLLALLALLALPAVGQLRRDEVPLTDVLEVVLVDRDLVAIDANGGGQVSERLELGEELRWKASRGKVGIALTDRRVLAVATGSASWQQSRYRRTEPQPEQALLGERVALLTTPERAIGFNGETGNLIEADLGPREHLLARRVGENVAVVITERRALGLSPFAGGFFSRKLELGERVESVEALSNLATVTTTRRVLVFRAPTGSWEVRRRDLR